tara:strand:- start:696 stop:1115 length:420 start_codon:yes stop_codon:yes gene_type:complete
MKIQEEYSNFEKGLLFLIGDKHPTLASNDSKKLSYFISLANFKNGFDYYELTRLSDGGVYFSIVTMLGFKTIVQSDSQIFTYDISENEWNSLIFKISMNHFNKEQYQALKKGYVKKESKGCMNSIAFVILFILGVISFY